MMSGTSSSVGDADSRRCMWFTERRATDTLVLCTPFQNCSFGLERQHRGTVAQHGNGTSCRSVFASRFVARCSEPCVVSSSFMHTVGPVTLTFGWDVCGCECVCFVLSVCFGSTKSPPLQFPGEPIPPSQLGGSCDESSLVPLIGVIDSAQKSVMVGSRELTNKAVR